MACLVKTRDGLCDFMEEHMVSLKFRGISQDFLPRSAFKQVTGIDVIQEIVQCDGDLYLPQKEMDRFILRVHKEAPKIFATCIHCDLPMTTIRVLLENNITDAQFPLDLDDCPMELKKKRAFKNHFIINQKQFNVPYFEENSIQNLNEKYSMPVDFDEGQMYLRGKGAFGEVWEVSIHPDHRAFGKGRDEITRYAMKVIQHEKSIIREKEWIKDMSRLSHANLVKCLTSWTLEKKLYMIYELAECNLEEFMARRNSGNMARGVTHAMFLKQLCGLARALRVIHHQEGEPQDGHHTNMFLRPGGDNAKSGYIHDFKPENILVFMTGNQVRSFRISDFSCAKVVDFIATVSGNNRRSHMTESKSGTPIYRAPESVHGKTSRPYDLWSFGCVYLELLVWYLDGYKALEEFREARYGPNGSKGLEDEGFYSTTGEGENAKVKLREPVVNKIKELSERCQGGLKEIANIIPSLLEIDPKRRLTAAQLVKRLEHLDTSVEMDANAGQPAYLGVSSSASTQLPSYDSDSSIDGLITVKVIHATE